MQKGEGVAFSAWTLPSRPLHGNCPVSNREEHRKNYLLVAEKVPSPKVLLP